MIFSKEMTITPVPFRGVKFIRYSNSIAGTRKASVFPEPVLAAPTTSFPIKRRGIAPAWIYTHEILEEKSKR
ncbi:hypothetical protein Taro_048278 [Colocasia esculenta]|uniref:Uncharacterized protein n=1 Tax=Colocasia esculenta TaxID=4460 RepID=A0A843X7S2_COLES|nr:hypothetical protein [Colocasia esculenta]